MFLTPHPLAPLTLLGYQGFSPVAPDPQGGALEGSEAVEVLSPEASLAPLPSRPSSLPASPQASGMFLFGSQYSPVSVYSPDTAALQLQAADHLAQLAQQ
eukprot:8323139-Prorocentrum_lima.AAC.1